MSVTRRELLLGLGAAAGVMALGGCEGGENGKKDRLHDYMDTDSIKALDLEEMSGVRGELLQVSVSDNKPTYVHIYDDTITANLQAIESAYAFFSPENLPNIEQLLKSESISGDEYIDKPEEPPGTYYSYQFDSSFLPVFVALLPREEIRQRHLLALSNTKKGPSWMDLPPNFAQEADGIVVSAINMERLRTLTGRDQVAEAINPLALVEMFYQMYHVNVRTVDGQLIEKDDPRNFVFAEGVARGFSAAANLKRIGFAWSSAEMDLHTFQLPTHVNLPDIPPFINIFPINESVYNTMPSDGPLFSDKSN